MEALLLTEQEPVHIELAPDQFRQHIGLEQLEGVEIRSGQLDIDRAVEQRLTVAVHGSDQRRHILKVAFGGHGLLEVVGVGAVHAVLVGRIVDDFLFLCRCDLPGVDAQGDAVLFPQVAEDRLLIRAGGIFPQCPDAAIGVAEDKVVGIELHHRGCDHVQIGLDIRFRMALRYGFFRLLFQYGCLLYSPTMTQRSPS